MGCWGMGEGGCERRGVRVYGARVEHGWRTVLLVHKVVR